MIHLRAYNRCDADGCTATRRLIFIAAIARLGDEPADIDYGYKDVGLQICPLHAKLALNGMHIALRSAKPNPHGTIVLIGHGTPRVGIVDTAGDEVTV